MVFEVEPDVNSDWVIKLPPRASRANRTERFLRSGYNKRPNNFVLILPWSVSMFVIFL